MLPIEALGERQTWCRDAFSVHAHFVGDRINAYLATVGRDGDLPANPDEEAWFEAATAGVEGVHRDWGPSWTIPPQAWLTIAARLDVWLSLRQLRYQQSLPELATLLVAELASANWSATGYWVFSPTDSVMIEVHCSGTFAITGGDPHLEALREHTGLALEAPTTLHRRLLAIDPESARDVFGRVASWSPQALSWVQAAIYGVKPS